MIYLLLIIYVLGGLAFLDHVIKIEKISIELNDIIKQIRKDNSIIETPSTYISLSFKLILIIVWPLFACIAIHQTIKNHFNTKQ